MCPNCEKCKVVKSFDFQFYDDGSLDILLNPVFMSYKETGVTSRKYSIISDTWIHNLREYFKKMKIGTKMVMNVDSSFFKEFSEESASNTKNYEPSENTHIFYTQNKLSKILLMRNKVNIVEKEKNKTFPQALSHFINTNQVHNQKQNKSKQGESLKEVIDEELECPTTHIYGMEIRPDNFKGSINGILTSPKQVFVVSDFLCPDNSNKVADTITEVSLSFFAVSISNFLQEIFFSILNSKDMLDIVFYDEVSKPEEFLKIDNFFTTFDCHLSVSFSSSSESFRSNLSIKSLFLEEYGSGFTERENKKNVTINTMEYHKQTISNFPKGVNEVLKCRFKFMSTDYVFLAILGCRIIVFFLKIISFRKNVKNDFYKKVRTKILGLDLFLHKQLNQICLFLFFNNLVFCLSIIKLIKPGFLGLSDFLGLSLKMLAIGFPIYNMTEHFQQFVSQNFKWKLNHKPSPSLTSLDVNILPTDSDNNTQSSSAKKECDQCLTLWYRTKSKKKQDRVLTGKNMFC
jgi:hypothetical protein